MFSFKDCTTFGSRNGKLQRPTISIYHASGISFDNLILIRGSILKGPDIKGPILTWRFLLIRAQEQFTCNNLFCIAIFRLVFFFFFHLFHYQFKDLLQEEMVSKNPILHTVCVRKFSSQEAVLSLHMLFCRKLYFANQGFDIGLRFYGEDFSSA